MVPPPWWRAVRGARVDSVLPVDSDLGRRRIAGISAMNRRHVQHEYIHAVLVAHLHVGSHRLSIGLPLEPEADTVPPGVTFAPTDIAKRDRVATTGRFFDVDIVAN